MNNKNLIKIYKKNYIELFGLPGAGKTYIQNKIINTLKKNNLEVFHQKELIIKFYLKNFIINPIHYIKIYLILFFYSKFFTFIKYFFKTKRKIITKNDKVYFLSQKRRWYHKIVDQLRLNNNYQKILNFLAKKIIKKNNYRFYKIVLKEIDNLTIDIGFKLQLKKWFIESIVIVEIQKKQKHIYCVIDEGVLHRLFTIFILKKNKKTFLKKIIKYFENYGELYLVKTNLKNIYKRTIKREKIYHGFIYSDKKQIKKYYQDLRLFEKFIQKKIIYKTIIN